MQIGPSCGIVSNHFTANLRRNLPVKKLCKSIKIWPNYGHEFLRPHFFGPPCSSTGTHSGEAVVIMCCIIHCWQRHDGHAGVWTCRRAHECQRTSSQSVDIELIPSHVSDDTQQLNPINTWPAPPLTDTHARLVHDAPVHGLCSLIDRVKSRHRIHGHDIRSPFCGYNMAWC